MSLTNQYQYSKRSILYYPTINIPTNSWLRQAILYWDEVNSIIPKVGNGKLLTQLSPDILYLLDEGEFKPIHPEDLVFNDTNTNAFSKFENEFIQTITSEQFKGFLSKNYYGQSKSLPNVKHWSKIHKNKTSDNLWYNLSQLGLSKQSQEDEWHEFETNTALLYMSLLAKHLASVQKNQTTIGTDYNVYHNFNFKLTKPDNGNPVININLDRLLPVPNEGVPFDKIIEFKNKRKDNLIRFRKHLLEFYQRLGKSNSNEDIQNITSDFKDELILGLNDMKHVLKDAKIKSTLKSLKSLINIQSPTTLVTAGSFIASKMDYLPDKLIIPIAIVSGSIELTLNYIEDTIDKKAQIRDSPLSYVFQAQKAGILPAVN